MSASERVREVQVECANEMFTVDVQIRDRDGGVVGDFALESEAGLLDTRGDEVGGKGGDVVGDALSESGGKRARGRHDGAGDQRIGIRGKGLVVVILRVVEEDLRVGDAVFGGHDGVVDLRNADVEQSVAGTDDERVRAAEGVSESDAWAEDVRLEGDSY